MSANLLAYGDNLDVLKRHVPTESVDLVYLDPPFNSNANYNILFEEHGERAAAQIKAFGDTWGWDTVAARAYQEVVEAGGDVATTLRAFRTMLGTADMLAYLSMMAPRLVELHRVLKGTGSLYLHCDPTASHYLKLLLDAVFGAANFRSEITWKRTNVHNDSGDWSAVADTLLYYVKDARSAFRWNPPLADHAAEYIAEKYRHRETDGRAYRLSDLNAPGGRGPVYEFEGLTRAWRFTEENMRALDAEGRIYKKSRVPQLKRYLDKMRGTLVTNVWTDINPINSMARERLGYPTQKPVALLERVIAASSDAGDIVLDPFCGCGTAVDAAQSLERQWIGIDVTHLAIGLIKHRLVARYGPEIADTVRIIGEPTTVEDAAALAQDDPFQFQAWALGLVGARQPNSARKGGDKGIDGRLYFHDGPGGPTHQIVLSVKAGHINPSHVRDLVGVLDRERAQIGVLISLEEPTLGMRTEAASAGFFESPTGQYPRVQLRTVGELLAGRGIQYPPVAATVYRPTLFAPAEVPVVTVKRRRVSKKSPAGQPPAFDSAAIPRVDRAAQVRDDLAKLGGVAGEAGTSREPSDEEQHVPVREQSQRRPR